MHLKEIQQLANQITKEKGFGHGERNIPGLLALIHAEVSEALEDYRKDADLKTMRLENGKLVGFPSELADVIIRVGDLAEYMGIDLDDAVSRKLENNKNRAHKFGDKRV
jgi:NTP pyrophosphatase (non-canonical NTP hydrolase)